MKSLRKFSKIYYVRQIVACFLVCYMSFGIPVQVAMAETPPAPGALPGEGNVISNSWGADIPDMFIDVNPNLRQVISPDSLNNIIEWNNFDIDQGKTLSFTQNGGWMLNNVQDSAATGIWGNLLGSNCGLIVVNPKGIVFGPASFINARNFVASTLDAVSFNADTLDFIKGDGIGKIDVMEGAQIQADELLALIGQKVINAGTISCPDGLVLMAAGDRVYLSTAGSDVVVEMSSVTIPDTPPFDGMGDVINEGTITTNGTNGGEIILAAGDIFSAALDKVIFGVGRVVQNGQVHANGTTGDGGTVTLTSADETILSSGSVTTANAGTGGDSGLVTVHSATTTIVDGPQIVDDVQINGAQIQATGGYTPVEVEDSLAPLYLVTKNSVEIIGDTINFAGSIDASATDITKKGKIWIEADNLTIADGYMPDDPLDNTLYEEWIEAQSGAGYREGTDLELVAHARDKAFIVVEAIGDGITGGRGDIYLRTKYDTGGISFVGPDPENPTHAPATLETDDGGNIFMVAGSGGITTGDIETRYDRTPGQKNKGNAGRIRLLTSNNGAIQTGSIQTEGAIVSEISAIAAGDLTINGEVFAGALTTDDPTKPIGFSRICLVSVNGDVTVDGSSLGANKASIEVSSHGKEESNADVLICAGKNVELINFETTDSVKAFAQVSTADAGNFARSNVTIVAGGLEEPPDPEHPTVNQAATITINGETDIKALSIKAEAKVSGAPGGASMSVTPLDDEPEVPDDDENTVIAEDGDAFRTVEIKINKDFAERQPEDPCPDCPCEDCPTPPDFPGEVFAVDDFAEEHMDTTPVDETIDGFGSVFDNDLGATDVLVWSPTEFGTLTINLETGEFEYLPPPGFVGTVTSTYLATDGETTDTATLYITLTNERPIATDGSADTHMGVPVDGTAGFEDVADVVDSIPYLDTVEILDYTQPSHGTVTMNKTDGSFTYTPDPLEPGYTGPDSFTYRVVDPEGVVGEGGTGTVTITLSNVRPIATDGSADTHMGVPVDGTAGFEDVADVVDSIPYLDAVEILGYTQPSHGTVMMTPDGSFTYTPLDPGYTGTDSFTYTVVDPEGVVGEGGEGTVTITLTNVRPIATDGSADTHMGIPVNGSAGFEDVADVVDSIPYLDAVEILDYTQPSHGTVTMNPDGSFTYTPDTLLPLYTGADSFTYRVVDPEGVVGEGGTGTVTITLSNVRPIAYDGSYETQMNIPVSGTLSFEDVADWVAGIPYLDDVEVSGFTMGSNGTVWASNLGDFTYTPDPGYTGTDSFMFAVRDPEWVIGEGGWGTVTITISFTPPTLVPVAPLPELQYPEVQGCPVLMQAVALELGVPEETIQVAIGNALAVNPNIQSCEACASLMDSVAILRDIDGTRMAAMVQVFNALAPPDAPFTPEMAASIATAFADDIDNPEMPQYATVAEYIDAFVQYIAVLDTEFGSPVDDSVAFVMEKYGAAIAGSDNPNIGAFVTTRLESLETFGD
jgi:filamentous hemagglutinin family protein